MHFFHVILKLTSLGPGIYHMKSLKIPKGQSESVNRRRTETNIFRKILQHDMHKFIHHHIFHIRSLISPRSWTANPSGALSSPRVLMEFVLHAIRDLIWKMWWCINLCISCWSILRNIFVLLVHLTDLSAW
jgi:hypothetical protein